VDLAIELIVAIVIGVLVLVAGGLALLRGRPPRVPIDEETAVELRQQAPAPPPPVAEPDELEGVEPPQPVDLEDPALAGPVEALPAPVTPADRFRDRLRRARNAFGASVSGILGRGLDEEAWEDLEESLIGADVGVEATLELVQGLRNRVRAEGIRTGEGAIALLKEVLRLELSMTDRTLHRRPDGTSVWLVTGVNGTGKTTSIGKIAARAATGGDTVVLAAADTFRAAAGDQLQVWGERAGARVVRGGEGTDPAAVAFDGYQAARSAGADLLLVDTAGRLQNKTELMAELGKVKRVLEREAGRCDEVLLVLDATTGQNGLAQARAFLDTVDVTGVVLTKLDGTAKGGIVIAIQRQLSIPVKLVGLGESIDDLAEFDPDAFVDALFGTGAQDIELDEDSDGHSSGGSRALGG
jgi:fused signal recognition particle receptor